MSTNTHEFETIEIPLRKLLAWNENVRTTSADLSIGELAASIASIGLLQSLVVKKAPHGKFSVIAGKRRLQALSQLAETGTLKPDFAVPCRVVVHDADLTEISLTENVQREPCIPPTNSRPSGNSSRTGSVYPMWPRASGSRKPLSTGGSRWRG